ncbi:hypothetical protein AAE478_006199 [Parahypoxylon ruwenzoriense]
MALLCFWQGVYLAPCAERVYHRPARQCYPCEENDRRCDHGRPCHSCLERDEECTGYKNGCFWRGVEGDQFYGFFLNLGRGPTGINDLNVPEGRWEMPGDYHLQFREHQLLQDANSTERDRAHYREYQEVMSILRSAMQSGIPADLAGISRRMQIDYNAWIPVNESQSCRDVLLFLKRTAVDHPRFNNPVLDQVTIDVSQAVYPIEEIQALNPHPSASLFNRIAPIKNVTNIPLTRLPSPGPSRPQYHIHWSTRPEDLPVMPNDNLFPLGHPERVNVEWLKRPLPLNPGENTESQLNTIPYNRIWDDGVMYASVQQCEASTTRYVRCSNFTTAGCEDTRHTGQGCAICDECEQRSREAFMQKFSSLIMRLRTYLCAHCTGPNGLPFPQIFNGLGNDVFYDLASFPGPPPDFSGETILGTGLTNRVGAYRGSPLNITGCSCAVRLFGRRICNPHRITYLMNMERIVTNMRAYCKNLYGRMVCPACRLRPGIDSYQFTGEQGGANNVVKCYGCLNCHQWVLSKNPVSIGEFPRNSLNAQGAPPPYTCRNEERHGRVLIN